MLITALFSWWYSAGWMSEIGRIKVRLLRASDSFSIITLLKTLFSPYRQIAAGGTRGPLGVKLRAWFDRLISRFIGLLVRSIVVLIGLLYLLLLSVVGFIRIVLWPLVPILPIIVVLLWVIGVSL